MKSPHQHITTSGGEPPPHHHITTPPHENMYIPFNTLPDSARIWIYQANRTLQANDALAISDFLTPQIQDWSAHQQPLLASFKIIENRFVVIAVDENESLPSGCSIDKSTHWLQQLGAKLNIDFFDRSVAYLEDETIKTLPVNAIKAAVLENQIEPNTLIFNNLIKTKAEFESSWKVSASESWVKRFFKLQATL